QLAVAVRPLLVDGHRGELQEMAALALEERGVRAVTIHDALGRAVAHAGPRLQTPLAQLPAEAVQRPLDAVEQFIQPVLPASQYTTSLTSASAPVSSAPLGWITLEYSRQHQWLSRYRTVLIGLL